jgi:hypothetical protein
MPTLQERFADLADDAPVGPATTGSGAAGIWAEGRRRHRSRRIGTAVVGAVTLAVLAAVASLAVHRASSPGYADSDSTPALPSVVHHPSPWLSGWGDRPPGRLSMLIPGKRGGWPHYHWGMVGVSATTGAYHYLEIPGCLDVDGLSPDGLHVSCFAGKEIDGRQVITGVAIYNTATGHVDRWVSPRGRLALNTVTWSGNDAVVFRADDTSYRWQFGRSAPKPIPTRLTLRVGVAGPSGTAGLYLSGPDGFFYLPPGRSAKPTRIVLGRDARTTTPAAVSPSGQRIVLAGTGLTDRALEVGEVRPGHPVRVHPVPADLRVPQVVGWADEHHVLVVAQVSGGGTDTVDDPHARYDLDSVDVDSGQVVRVARMSDEQTSWGAIFATSLLGSPTRDFPAPPDPINQRLEAGLVVGVLLLGGVALVLWRRRVRA